MNSLPEVTMINISTPCSKIMRSNLKGIILHRIRYQFRKCEHGNRLTTVAFTSQRNKDLLKGISQEHLEDVARTLELAERARDTWSTLYSTFYPPPVIADAMLVISRMADVVAVPWGGYERAERCRLVVTRCDESEASADDNNKIEDDLKKGCVAAIEVKGNFIFDSATHRDFLGAVLGTGIERSVVGDILVQGERGAQILTTPEMVEYLEQNLTQVRTVPVKTSGIEMNQLRVPEARTQEIRSVESSMRLDSIASAGFRMSRQKALDRIKSGDVKLNWKSEGFKPSSIVREGDIISCIGKGRVEVKEVGSTKKGKFSVYMVRYV